MQNSVRTNALLLTVGLTCVAGLPGAWTMATTPARDLTLQFGDGATQRLYESRFEENFPFSADVRHAWAAIKMGLFGEPAAGAILGKEGILFTEEEFKAPDVEYPFPSYIAGVHASTSKMGAHLLPVIIPDKARMMAKALPRPRSSQFERRYDALLDMLASQGLPAIDLRPALASSDSFMLTDTHWSPQGAQRVAALIAKHTRDIVGQDRPLETVKGEIRAFEGDLMAFVDTGPWRPLVGPNAETITTYDFIPVTGQAGSDLDLFGEVVIPAALVGTSFSARTDFYFSDFLKAEMQADLVSYALEGLGPFEPMQRFLQDRSVSENPPQIVIWEIPERYINTWSLTND
ncbi:MAG: hypothetical protein AAFR71_09740 [Pseudomonadota bacterium]